VYSHSYRLAYIMHVAVQGRVDQNLSSLISAFCFQISGRNPWTRDWPVARPIPTQKLKTQSQYSGGRSQYTPKTARSLRLIANSSTLTNLKIQMHIFLCVVSERPVD
jgi:hypothetical protein